jgi:hypothetical protein
MLHPLPKRCIFIVSRLDIGHHHSPTKMLRGSRKACRADKLANGKEPKDARRGCPSRSQAFQKRKEGSLRRP